MAGRAGEEADLVAKSKFTGSCFRCCFRRYRRLHRCENGRHVELAQAGEAVDDDVTSGAGLGFRWQVLPLTAAAVAEVKTGGWTAVRARCQHFDQLGLPEVLPATGHLGADPVARRGQGYEDRPPVDAADAVAAGDEPVDAQFDDGFVARTLFCVRVLLFGLFVQIVHAAKLSTRIEMALPSEWGEVLARGRAGVVARNRGHPPGPGI